MPLGRRTGVIGLVLALAALIGGDFAQAEHTDMQKESPANHQKKAEEFYEKGREAKDLSEKESFYIKTLELWPEYPEAHNDLGDVYEKQRRFGEAIKEYEIASSLAPEAPYPYFGLGDVYFKLGRYEEATINYEKGLKIEPGDRLSEENLKIAKILSRSILFPFDSVGLTEAASGQLKEMARAISSPNLANLVFEIQGHTDSVGPEEYNLGLSEKRAERVKKYLIEKCGVVAAKLVVKGYGEGMPVASSESQEGRRMNRRVELRRINKDY